VMLIILIHDSKRMLVDDLPPAPGAGHGARA
jgi:hypothetical protein